MMGPTTGFNPRTHTGCDTLLCLSMIDLVMFQSTHPHGVRLAFSLNSSQLVGFQSTHPHGVRPTLQGAQSGQDCFNPRTHTGCDHSVPACTTALACFNPRTHTGCDVSGTLWRLTKYVSIHAPTRGATASFATSVRSFKFQSTHPHGVRLRNTCAPCSRRSFNPRTHTGCDAEERDNLRRVIVSIHAPTRGATPQRERHQD